MPWNITLPETIIQFKLQLMAWNNSTQTCFYLWVLLFVGIPWYLKAILTGFFNGSLDN